MNPGGQPVAHPGPGSAPPYLPPEPYQGQYQQPPAGAPEMIELSGSDLEDDGLDGEPTESAAPIGVADTLGYPGPGAPPGPPAGHGQPMGPGPGPMQAMGGPGPAGPPSQQPYQPPAPVHAPAGPGPAPMAAAPPHMANEPVSLSPQAAGPQVQIIGGNNRGREYPLHFGDNSIGRGVDNDVILADIAVSRKHTIICWENGRFMVRDLGSGNGTLHNGKRVDTQPLRDGDQMELGNTLLRFICPPHIMSPEVAAAETVVTGRDEPQAPLMALEDAPYRHKTELAIAEQNPMMVRQAKGKGKSRTVKLAIFGSVALVILFGGMFGLKMMLNAKKGDVSTGQHVRSPDEVAAEEFQKGTTQFQARNWEKAQTHFLKVLKLAPSFEHAKRYADRAAKEILARDTLKKAKKSLKGKDYKAAREQLAKVPSTSVYSADARKAKQSVDDQQVTALLKEARDLKAAEDTEGALAKVKEAQKISPTNQVVKELYAELSGTESTTSSAGSTQPGAMASRRTNRAPVRRNPVRRTNPVRRNHTPASRTRPIRVGRGKGRAAIKLYKQRQWAQAFNAIKDHAASQTGPRKRQAEQLADAIRTVASSWIRGERATKPAKALKYYQKALSADRKAGGYHQRALKKMIYDAAKRQATNSLSKKRYSSAFAAYKAAKKYGPEDAVLRRVMSALERKAQELFTKGYTKRTTNIAYARKLWQQVLRMVPHNNPHYTKAYQYLNSSTPSYQDEDED